MGATYYSQILRSTDWAAVVKDLDAAITEFREEARRIDEGHGSEALDTLCIERRHAMAQLAPDAFPGRVVEASTYFGSVLNNIPSGSIYAPWSPVGEEVRARDAAWWAALEKVASKFDLSVETGEGDPNDIYIHKYVDIDEEESI